LWVKDDDDEQFSREKGDQNFLQTLVRESEEDCVKKIGLKSLNSPFVRNYHLTLSLKCAYSIVNR
jgi:hypothetical protein